MDEYFIAQCGLCGGAGILGPHNYASPAVFHYSQPCFACGSTGLIKHLSHNIVQLRANKKVIALKEK